MVHSILHSVTPLSNTEKPGSHMKYTYLVDELSHPDTYSVLSLTWTLYCMDVLFYPTQALWVYSEQLSPPSTLDILHMFFQPTSFMLIPLLHRQPPYYTHAPKPHTRPPLCTWIPSSLWSGKKKLPLWAKKVDRLMQMLLTKLFRKGRGKQTWKTEIILRIVNYLFQKLKDSYTYNFICPKMESHSLH